MKKQTKLGVRLGMVACSLLLISNSYAITVIPQKDGNFTVINDNGTKATDLSFQTIEDNYHKYGTGNWECIYNATVESLKQKARNNGRT